jgi:hypothetical protein
VRVTKYEDTFVINAYSHFIINTEEELKDNARVR